MVLKMKNINILGIHWKIQLLDGGSWKTNIEGGWLAKEGGLEQFADLRGVWQGRGGSVFEGRVDTLMQTMAGCIIFVIL